MTSSSCPPDATVPRQLPSDEAQLSRTLHVPQLEPRDSRQERAAELAATRSRWSWNLDDRSVPPRLSRVPLSEIPLGGLVELLRTQGRLWLVQARSNARRLLARWTGFGRPSAPFQAFTDLFGRKDLPTLAQRWRSDEEFAMQRLNGLWPDLIARCAALPDNFSLTDDLVAGLLPPGETIRSLIDGGRLYIVNQRILEGYPQVKDHVTAAPISVFYTDVARARLMPLAVKLTQDQDAPIFTPRDPPGLWLAVKAFVNNADLIVHVAVKHFLRMHFTMEAFYGAMVRNLSKRHPIHAFVRPHFYLMLFANMNVRNMILRETDWWIIRRAWPTWTFAELHVPRDYQRRGVDDPALLPNFHFRDESLAMWEAFHEYVTSIVRCIYASDAEVAGDEELQSWMGELGAPEVCGLRGLPVDADGRMSKRDQLVDLLTSVLFNVTTRHNHNTNAGRQYYAFTPNTPLTLTLPLPATKAVDIPEEALSNAMPEPGAAAKVIADIESVQNLPGTFNLLARYAPDFLAGYPAARELVLRFQARLVEIDNEMKRRDEARPIPYPYLYPTLTANSVWS